MQGLSFLRGPHTSLAVSSPFFLSLGVTESETHGPRGHGETLSPTLLLDGGKQGLEAGGGEGGDQSRLFPSAPCEEGGGGVSCF